MALLPDLATAGTYALIVFLITLGALVVFVEAVPRRIIASILLVALVAAIVLSVLGELGVGLLFLGFAAALLANGLFEGLTTR